MTDTNTNTGEFTVNYTNLADALKTLALPTLGRNAFPAAAYVLATIRDNQVELSTSNYDAAVTVTLPAGDTQDGQTMLPHAALTKTIAAAVKGLPKAKATRHNVTITVENGTPNVHVNGYSLPLDGDLSPDAFWTAPDTAAAETAVDRVAFTNLAAKVGATADRTDTLPVLEGINITVADGRVTMTATDKYRLATGSVDTDGGGARPASALIPADALTKLLPRLAGETIRFGIDDMAFKSWATFTDGTTVIRLRFIEGEFPNVGGLLDSKTTRWVTVDSADLLENAVRAAALSVAGGAKNRPLLLAIRKGTLTVLPATTGDPSKVSAPEMNADIEGDTREWVSGVAPGFFVEAVKSIDSAWITLRLRDERAPIVLVADLAGDRPEFQHLLMPVRI